MAKAQNKIYIQRLDGGFEFAARFNELHDGIDGKYKVLVSLLDAASPDGKDSSGKILYTRIAGLGWKNEITTEGYCAYYAIPSLQQDANGNWVYYYGEKGKVTV